MAFDDPMPRLLMRVDYPSRQDLEQAVDRAEMHKISAMDKDFWDLKARTESHDEEAIPLTRAEKNRFNLKKLHISSFEEQKKHFEFFLTGSEYYLGHIVSGSGLYRTRQQVHIKTADCPSVIDWAIIDIDQKRMGANKVCSFPFFLGETFCQMELTGTIANVWYFEARAC